MWKSSESATKQCQKTALSKTHYNDLRTLACHNKSTSAVYVDEARVSISDVDDHKTKRLQSKHLFCGRQNNNEMLKCFPTPETY